MASGVGDVDPHVYIIEDDPEPEEEEEEEEEVSEEESENGEEEEEDEEYVPNGPVSLQSEAVNADVHPATLVSVAEHIQGEAPLRQGGENAEAGRREEVSQRAGVDALGVVEEGEGEQRHAGTEGGPGGEENVGESCLGQPVRSDMDTSVPNCPICMERWTCEGVHRVCCIPCGHVYGRSCLERWFKRCRNTFAKCPQCKRRFKIKDIINLYAPQITVVNDDLEKEVTILREKNEFLNMERKKLLEEVCKLKKDVVGEDLTQSKKPCLHQVFSGATNMSSSNFINELRIHPGQAFLGPGFASQHYGPGVHRHGVFALQDESEFDGARVLDIDASSQISLVSGKSSGWRGGHFLTKISLLCPDVMQNVLLPDDTGTVRDLHLAPANTVLPGRLVLLASLGKKLSVFSMESNNVVLKYNLPGPSWSCSWDATSPHHVYAGLQNGMLSVFDVRQTARPLESRAGLSGHPLHTIHSLALNEPSTTRTLLTASSVGPCLWDVGGNEMSPSLLTGTENQGVCISLACGNSGGDDVVASFRPKVKTNSDAAGSQSSQTPSPTVSGPVRLGTHVHLKRVHGNTFQKHAITSGNVSEVRMSRSAVMHVQGGDPLFAHGDEAFHGLCIWDLMSFQVVQHLKPHDYPILDIKYSSSIALGILGCVSENRLQVFRVH